ncbi:hypothetical protein Godav_029457 [Gossypium davidsonii]|uniref:DUF7745 domain-containing protein n=1 Tax=Gossypium davidsonii TaxID=34287 RepID=A0A7J8TJ72_GOSDV|nr:hypothetical protein [Gossypium davidsonii]
MENGFLDKVEDNAAVRTWSEKTQLEKGDSLVGGYTSELWNYTRISVTQNNLRELKELILAHPDARKKVDVFALSIYRLVIFPRALGHVDEATSDLFDRLDKRIAPVSAILAETFRSLNACRRTGAGRFIGCVQLLLAWFHSHFWKTDNVSYQVFSENYSPLKEIAATLRRDDISEEKWLVIFQNLHDEDIEWRAPWLLPDEILYRCGSYDWVPLLGIWRAVGYATLMVLR